jgi:hypothetical protein
MNSHLWWVHAHYSPQLVERWTCVSSPLLSHTPHRRRTGGSRGATQRRVRFDLGGVSQLTLWRQGWTLVRSIFIFYFVRLPLCKKYSDYCDIYLYTLCYYICCLLWRMYEMQPALSLKTGCDKQEPCGGGNLALNHSRTIDHRGSSNPRRDQGTSRVRCSPIGQELRLSALGACLGTTSGALSLR